MFPDIILKEKGEIWKKYKKLGFFRVFSSFFDIMVLFGGKSCRVFPALLFLST